MLPFKPKELVSQSVDGLLLTLTDDSNYGDNSDAVDAADIVTRVITVYDVNDNLQGTINQALNTPATWPVTADQDVRFHLAFSKGDATLFEADVKYISTRFYNNAQRTLAAALKCGCKCDSKTLESLNAARELYNSAIDSFITGDDINAQQSITDANIFINQTLQSC